MIQHPSIAADLAQQRRAAFMAEAETARLAREARNGRTTGLVRIFTARRHPRHATARKGLARLRPVRAR